MVGELPVIGLFSEWDDSARANDNIPPLNEPWDYGKQPIRGVNVGGEFSLSPHTTSIASSTALLTQGVQVGL